MGRVSGGRFCLLGDALPSMAQADRTGPGRADGIFGMESEKDKGDGAGTGVWEGIPNGTVVSVTQESEELCRRKLSLEVKLPNTDRCNIAGKAGDMHVEESLEVKLPNTDRCNIAGKASDMHVEESLEVKLPKY